MFSLEYRPEEQSAAWMYKAKQVCIPLLFKGSRPVCLCIPTCYQVSVYMAKNWYFFSKTKIYLFYYHKFCSHICFLSKQVFFSQIQSLFNNWQVYNMCVFRLGVVTCLCIIFSYMFFHLHAILCHLKQLVDIISFL